MLLRRESLEPPMSQLGQKAKYSLRVDVVRCCPNNRHAATATPCPFGANNRHDAALFDYVVRQTE
jgi:hypothetical protein